MLCDKLIYFVDVTSRLDMRLFNIFALSVGLFLSAADAQYPDFVSSLLNKASTKVLGPPKTAQDRGLTDQALDFSKTTNLTDSNWQSYIYNPQGGIWFIIFTASSACPLCEMSDWRFNVLVLYLLLACLPIARS